MATPKIFLKSRQYCIILEISWKLTELALFWLNFHLFTNRIWFLILKFPFFSRWNLTTMFWQKIQIFLWTHLYQIYIKIHAMSVCLSVLYFNSILELDTNSTPFPWTNLRAKYIYGILLTWWRYSRYSDYFKVIRIAIKN